MVINFKQCNVDNFKKCTGRDIEYIVIHYTGNKGDSAKNNADYFARESIKTSAHYFVDENEIWQSVHDADIAWHCGAKNYKHKDCRNSNSIGVEMCLIDKDGNLRHESIRNAVGLVVELMKKYRIKRENILRHFDVTGKNCPEPMTTNNKLWYDFKKKLEDIQDMKVYKYIPELPEWARDTFTRLYKAGVIRADKNGAVSIYETSLQPIVYIDRLLGNRIDKLSEIFYIFEEVR